MELEEMHRRRLRRRGRVPIPVPPGEVLLKPPGTVAGSGRVENVGCLRASFNTAAASSQQYLCHCAAAPL